MPPPVEKPNTSTMKKILFIAFAALASFWAAAQEPVARHNDRGMYIAHTVAAKENFYSLGRSYNMPPKDIAAYNNISMESGLTIGQVVNIPLSAANFSQDKSTTQPVYYVVGEKEGLYRVSVNNNKVLMANLRKWNNLQSDAISAGQKLIVGYLASTDAGTTTVAATTQTTSKPTVVEPKETVKQPEETVAKTEEKPVVQKPAEKKPEPQRTATTAMNDAAGGYFKTSFDAQVKTQPANKDEMATAGIFKTASGWQDAKYYALIDGVEPGTIIRVVNPNNSKAVYAKVLDKMAGVIQNKGYNVRISNAAATALEISDTEKFFVRVVY